MTTYITDFTARDGLVLVVVMLISGLCMGMVARLIR